MNAASRACAGDPLPGHAQRHRQRLTLRASGHDYATPRRSLAPIEQDQWRVDARRGEFANYARRIPFSRLTK